MFLITEFDYFGRHDGRVNTQNISLTVPHLPVIIESSDDRMAACSINRFEDDTRS